MTKPNRVVYILDLDRTLLNTTTVMQVFVAVCDAMGIDSSVIAQAEQESFRHGQSFQALEILKTIASTELIEKFSQRLFEESKKHRLLYEDAASLLAYLTQASHVDVMILTYGHGDWQRMKIQAAGLLNMHTVVTQEVMKSEILNAWVQAGGVSVPDMGTYNTAVFVDDKPISFSHISSQYASYLVNRSGGDRGAIHGIPEHVKIIKSLNEVERH